jgi:iron complex transport system substrate-binding protein
VADQAGAPLRLHEVIEALRPPGRDPAAEAAAQAHFEERSARLLALRMHVARYLVRSGAAQPTVIVLDSLDPPRTAGGWVPDIVDAAGGLPLLATPGEAGTSIQPEGLDRANIVVAGQPGLTAAQVANQLLAAARSGGWDTLVARHEARIWCVDYDALFATPNERLVESVEAMIRMILPAALGANGTPPPETVALRLPRPA